MLIILATADISEYMKAIPSYANERKKDIRHLNAQKIASLGLSEENMQAFQELMVNILKDSNNGIIGKR